MRHLPARLQTIEAEPDSTPDLEFMARMLGVQARRPVGGYHLADEVEARLADPIAVARAQQRIGGLIANCEMAMRIGGLFNSRAPRGYDDPPHYERLPSGHMLIS